MTKYGRSTTVVVEYEKLNFIHIPKCGGMSVNQHYLKKYYNKLIYLKERTHPYVIFNRTPRKQFESLTHFTYDEAWTQFPNFRYVTQVRYPLDRWVSLYKHFCDRNFILTWDIETWTENAMNSLKDACIYGVFENKKQFEHGSAFRDQSKMFLPAWMYYREPEVEVYKLEDQTIWKALNIPPCHVNQGKKLVLNYDRERIKELIYDYYKKDFEYYGG